jgi:hypothetical protein
MRQRIVFMILIPDIREGHDGPEAATDAGR